MRSSDFFRSDHKRELLSYKMNAQLLIAVLVVGFLLKHLRSFLQFLFDLERKLRLTKKIVGPESLPLIGCLHKMPSNAADILDFMVVEAQKALEKGESVMKMWVGPKLLVIPVNHEAAITSSSTEIDKGEDYRFFEQWLRPAILLGSGERWHRTRKMVTPAFHFAKIEEYVEAMDLHTRTRLLEWNWTRSGTKTSPT
ncbi:hypothetical protein M3Y99_01540800 [Aphelenchoides fujianensis]|nr:hypothetical protein M3Y99_01540800 [Aphelenchoides fujianensis]